jgi:hypothetical protein
MRARHFPASTEYSEYVSPAPYAWEAEYTASEAGKRFLAQLAREKADPHIKRDREHARAQRLAERAASDAHVWEQAYAAKKEVEAKLEQSDELGVLNGTDAEEQTAADLQSRFEQLSEQKESRQAALKLFDEELAVLKARAEQRAKGVEPAEPPAFATGLFSVDEVRAVTGPESLVEEEVDHLLNTAEEEKEEAEEAKHAELMQDAHEEAKAMVDAKAKELVAAGKPQEQAQREALVEVEKELKAKAAEAQATIDVEEDDPWSLSDPKDAEDLKNYKPPAPAAAPVDPERQAELARGEALRQALLKELKNQPPTK